MKTGIAVEQRKREDRRIEDLGPPPGVEEQRVRAERRHPDVEHIDFIEQIEVLSVHEDRARQAAR
jgi:hypothetical protein